ncbi:MAG TPA: ABC transporter permease subunit [Asanoa sp.]|jgi:ABC-2 type transport system permease protein|nr:ABC transporter permease subunit [Asanoa sp.]
MLRVELSTQLMRLRTLIALALLAAVPVLAGLSFASSAGHRNGTQGGLFGASPYSALNHTMASLEFIGPLLLPIVVALLAAAIAAADRDWGVLRYLYVAPVTRTRLLAGKLAAVAIVTTVALGCVLAAGLGTGLAIFGWHPFHLIGAADLSAGDAIGRVLAASGYTLLCMLAMAAIAFTLGLLLPRGAEAVAAAVGFVVAASILNGQSALHAVAVVLPVHYWQNWVGLFEPGGATGIGTGILVQLSTVTLCGAVCLLVLRRRDPAA